jgi:GNAT superfamily N-acetyltransferase
MHIVHSSLRDLPQLCEVHKSAFPKSLSSKQGNRFISKMLEWYIVSERGIFFHLENNKEIIGYCGGIITTLPNQEGAVTSISQYSFNEFIKSFLIRPWLLFHPTTLSKYSYIVKNILLRFGLKNKKSSLKSNEEFNTFTGLVVIGLKQEAQGKGAGALLLNEFEEQSIKLRVNRMRLSVIPQNSKAIKAYKKSGWKEGNLSNNSLSMFKIL